MARRGKSSPAEDLLELVVHLPWWAALGLAVMSYFVFHGWASQPEPMVPKLPGQVAQFATATIGRSIAGILQYVIPLMCVAGAGLSVWRRRQRRQRVARAAASPAADALNGMTWQQFEQLVGEGFRMQGYAVTETGGGGADGGVDLVLRKGAEKYLVQCKQWRALKVGVEVVRDLYGAMAASGAAGGFVVTSGRFTNDASAFASGRNLSLIDGVQLHAMLRRVQAGIAPTTASPMERPADSVPACPACGKTMVRRVARQGTRAGSDFWGCSGFPACRGTRPVA